MYMNMCISLSLSLSLSIYIYIYIYIHMPQRCACGVSRVFRVGHEAKVFLSKATDTAVNFHARTLNIIITNNIISSTDNNNGKTNKTLH